MNKSFIKASWSLKYYLFGVETNKNGVAILFGNTFEYKVFGIIRESNLRL